MCRRATCHACGRPTFSGCGMHVEQVLGDVAPTDRCRCREQKVDEGLASSEKGAPSWLRKLFVG